MSLFYKLVPMKSSFAGEDAPEKWYARAVTLDTVTTSEIADIIQRNCSVKRSDVKAVLEELVEVMTDKLQASMAVKIDGLGTFKAALSSTGSDSPAEFSVAENIKGTHINFLPEYHVDSATRTRTRALLSGMKIAEAPHK